MYFSHSAGWDSKVKAPARARFLVHRCELCLHMVERGRGLSGVSVIRALIPFVRAPPQYSIISQRAHALLTSHQGGVSISTYELAGWWWEGVNTNVRPTVTCQSIFLLLSSCSPERTQVATKLDCRVFSERMPCSPTSLI